MALLDNSNKHKYGHIIAQLHCYSLKGNSRYPADMNVMYKLLDEHTRNGMTSIDPNATGAPHLAFAQAATGKY